MSWAEIKKAINSNLAKPLDVLITEKAAAISTLITTTNNRLTAARAGYLDYLANSTYGLSAIKNAVNGINTIVVNNTAPRGIVKRVECWATASTSDVNTKEPSTYTTALSIEGKGRVLHIATAGNAQSIVNVKLVCDGKTVFCDSGYCYNGSQKALLCCHDTIASNYQYGDAFVLNSGGAVKIKSTELPTSWQKDVSNNTYYEHYGIPFDSSLQCLVASGYYTGAYAVIFYELYE